MKTISQEELDWFVEGEMERSERDELFNRMDKDPEAWKQCALALLERDALKRALRHAPSKADSKAESTAGLKKELAVDIATRPTSEKPTGTARPDAFRRRSTTWFNTLAAALLVAVFSLGYVFGGNVGKSQTVKDNRENNAAADVGPVSQELSPFVTRVVNLDSITIAQVHAALAKIRVPDQEVLAVVAVQHQDRQVVLPVIQSEQLARSLAELPAPAVPAGFAKRVRDSGFALQPNRQFVSLQNKDGTSQVQAFNMLDCHFVGKNVF